MDHGYSWIAIRGLTSGAALDLMELQETGETANALDSKFAAATLADGSVLVASQYFEFADQCPLAKLSTDGRVTTCCVNERLMYSSISQWESGKRLWYFFHDGGLGIQHMHTEGDPPPEFHAIANRLIVHQIEGEGIAITVDHVFEVAPEVAHALTGYRLESDEITLEYHSLTER